MKQQAKEYEVESLLGYSTNSQVYNRRRPQRRHTTAAGGTGEIDLTRLSSSPFPFPTEQSTSNLPLQRPITFPVSADQQAPQQTQSASQLEQDRPAPEKKGFFARKWLGYKQHRHSPVTERAHKIGLLGNLKAILFSSWVNLLLVFVPVVYSRLNSG